MTNAADRVIAAIDRYLGTKIADHPNACTVMLADGCGDMDSLDIIELIMIFEEEFNIEISDAEAEQFYPDHNGDGKTVGDLVALVEGKL